MIASHSSSFMRSSRLSRVMPALLTRIGDRRRARFSIAAERRVDRRRVGDVERRCPSPPMPASARYAVIAAAPASVVAVPTTVAPCAAQRRGDRAADAARRAGDQRDLSRQRPAHAALPWRQRPAPPARRRWRRHRRARVPRGSASMRLHRPVSTLPGPHSTTWVTPLRGHGLHGLDPAHRARRLARQRARGSPPASRCTATSTLCSTGIRGARERHLGRRARSALGRRLHQRAEWNGADTGSSTPRLAPRALAGRDRALDRRRVAGDDDLARGVEVDRLRRPRPAPASAQAAATPRRRRGPGPPPSRRRPPARPPASPARESAPAAPRRGTPAHRRRPAPCTRPGCGRRRCPVAARPRRATRATPRRPRSASPAACSRCG